MRLENRKVWQQAGGDTDRDYTSLCLSWDVILNGPGYGGAWPACKPVLAADGITSKKLSDLKRFAENVAEGDIIVLRIGTSTVRAVGEVVGPYEWRDDFGDVDGWDLQHVRRVRWLWKHGDSEIEFPVYAFKLGDTTQSLNEGPVLDWLVGLHIPKNAYSRTLKQLAIVDPSPEISIDEVSEFLFDEGVASDSISKLVGEIGELTRIAKWYRRTSRPSEHETVAYLVVPLLRALGWTPQRMAVEWNRVDVALFEKLPREDDSLRVVVEAKKMGSSCLSAKSQAAEYAEGKKACHRLIVTDGLRYGVYLRDDDGDFGLHAYLNLSRLKSDYPIHECSGTKQALLAMAPEWDPKKVKALNSSSR